MSLIEQSGDTELVNLLQGSTAGLGSTGPSVYNPQNLLTITVLIPQQISVQQLGNSEELSKVSASIMIDALIIRNLFTLSFSFVI
jgi:hypothetical protein